MTPLSRRGGIAVALAATIALTGCAGASGDAHASKGVTAAEADAFFGRTPGLTSTGVFASHYYQGLQKSTSILVSGTVQPGFQITDGKAFLSSAMELAWSVNDQKSQGIELQFKTTQNLAPDAAALGAKYTQFGDDEFIVDQDFDAKKAHQGGWPGKAPTKIDGIGPAATPTP